jgi:hypothetical protein
VGAKPEHTPFDQGAAAAPAPERAAIGAKHSNNQSPTESSRGCVRRAWRSSTRPATNRAGRHGRAHRGQPGLAAVPRGHWKTATFLAALRHDGMSAPGVFDSAINGRSLACCEPAPMLTLGPGDIVVLDDLATQKLRGRVRGDLGPVRPNSATCRPTAST